MYDIQAKSTDFRSGLYPKQFPYTVGIDAVGTLLSLPSSYAAPSDSSLPPLKVGDRILTTAPNAFAEYLVAPLTKIVPLPKEVDPKDGVALATTAFTAIGLITDSYAVKKGDWVLIRAASGGVGTLLVQVHLPYTRLTVLVQ